MTKPESHAKDNKLKFVSVSSLVIDVYKPDGMYLGEIVKEQGLCWVSNIKKHRLKAKSYIEQVEAKLDEINGVARKPAICEQDDYCALIEAAERYARHYKKGSDIKIDVLNAFYAGAKYQYDRSAINEAKE